MPFSHFICACIYIYTIIINFVLTFCHGSATNFGASLLLWEPSSWGGRCENFACGKLGFGSFLGEHFVTWMRQSAWGPFVRLLDAGCQLPRQAAPTAFGCWCSESSPCLQWGLCGRWKQAEAARDKRLDKIGRPRSAVSGVFSLFCSCWLEALRRCCSWWWAFPPPIAWTQCDVVTLMYLKFSASFLASMSGATCSAHVESVQIKSAGAFVDFPMICPFFRIFRLVFHPQTPVTPVDATRINSPFFSDDRGLQPWQPTALLVPQWPQQCNQINQVVGCHGHNWWLPMIFYDLEIDLGEPWLSMIIYYDSPPFDAVLTQHGLAAIWCLSSSWSATRVVGDSWCDGLHGVDIFDCNGLFGGGAGSIYHWWFDLLPWVDVANSHAPEAQWYDRDHSGGCNLHHWWLQQRPGI